MSFPPGTEMFQFPGFASPPYVFRQRYPIGVGCPIRISTDQRLLAAPHGFSQRATSFIASWCQGIHRMPLSRSRTERRRKGDAHNHHAQEPASASPSQAASPSTDEPDNRRIPIGRHRPVRSLTQHTHNAPERRHQSQPPDRWRGNSHPHAGQTPRSRGAPRDAPEPDSH